MTIRTALLLWIASASIATVLMIVWLEQPSLVAVSNWW